LRVTFHGRTDRGLRRPTNEDAFAFSDEDGFCVLCDGMGGHASGEVAAGLAVELLAARARKALGRGPGGRSRAEIGELRAELPRLVAGWLREANAAVYARGKSLGPAPRGRPMGTTIALLCVVEDFAVTANIGDTRIYLVRGGRIERLTRDHTVLSADLPLPRERRWKKKYVTRALGTRPAVESDVLAHDVFPGDRFLLCTDGLTDVAKDDEILAILETGARRPEAVLDALVELANARGGRDNVTVVLAELDAAPARVGVAGFDDAPSPEPPPLEPPPPWGD
jgi:protein phosphatase